MFAFETCGVAFKDVGCMNKAGFFSAAFPTPWPAHMLLCIA
jgi:hypothetical protein